MGEHATLIKFGNSQNILELQEYGLLYMNNLPYFWHIEDSFLRGDQEDSVAEVHRGSIGSVTFTDGTVFDISDWNLLLPPSCPENINIFCMYALRPFSNSFPVNEQNYMFGDTALVLLQPQEFINRIHSFLQDRSIPHHAALVTYVNTDNQGRIGPFVKRNNFIYQSEWRLVCYEGPGNARTDIRIGSIIDISKIIPSKEINNQIKVNGI
jgi:hypothetical protein